MTIAAQAVEERNRRVPGHTPACRPGPPGKPARQPHHTSSVPAIVSMPATCRLPGAGGGKQGGLNDRRQRGKLELVAITTGIVPARMPKKV